MFGLPIDKLLHALFGAIIMLITRDLGLLVSNGFVATAAALKEASDWLINKFNKFRGLPPSHGVEWADFGATVAGGLIASLGITIVELSAPYLATVPLELKLVAIFATLFWILPGVFQITLFYSDLKSKRYVADDWIEIVETSIMLMLPGLNLLTLVEIIRGRFNGFGLLKQAEVK